MKRVIKTLSLGIMALVVMYGVFWGVFWAGITIDKYLDDGIQKVPCGTYHPDREIEIAALGHNRALFPTLGPVSPLTTLNFNEPDPKARHLQLLKQGNTIEAQSFAPTIDQ